ncbi:hypothetical protein ABW20_dc0104615 [Dactylellina cionopaga]|nr:hypothetical protein ABW20_dc0104615 [Dactylellina cionopaga]
MPTLRQRASSASAETRDLWDCISASVGQSYSFCYDQTEPLPYRGPYTERQWPRIAVVASADPVDVALSMQTSDRLGCPKRVAVLNTANEKKAGGLWEGAVFAPEEALARRSNLVQTLQTGDNGASAAHHYPLPERGGLFSPRVAVIRGGPEQNYALWEEKEWRSVSVISVAPVRRPKVDESGLYSFPQERELQREKMRAILRMAAYQGINDICLSPFGCGSYKNPVEEVCQIWKELLLARGSEFEGWFRNVVFAVADGKGERNWEVFMQYFG